MSVQRRVDDQVDSKVVDSAEDAIADLVDGSSVAIAGFGLAHRFPASLVDALHDKASKDLTIVCNSLGQPGAGRPFSLVEHGQVSRLVACFSTRPGGSGIVDQQIAAGQLEVELVSQGALVERLRAAGAGIPAFYVATGAGTEIAAGKETRTFGGRSFVLEHALQVDFAFVRGARADSTGNVEFRGSTENFNPSFAKAATVVVAEVDEIVEVGAIEPERVGLPGIFVDRVVRSTRVMAPSDMPFHRRRRADSRRLYGPKPGLSRAEIARRAAALLPSGSYVNLGTGIPTLIAEFVDHGITLHGENGILGYGRSVPPEKADLDYFNASGAFVELQPGASFFDSIESFEMARGGHLDMAVLGAYQVNEQGGFANWRVPSETGGPGLGGGIGGAMDLAVGARTLVVAMEHCDSKGRPKLVKECTSPLTASDCVDIVVTDLALLRRRRGERFEICEIAEGFTVDEVLELTSIDVTVAPDLGIMQEAMAGLDHAR